LITNFSLPVHCGVRFAIFDGVNWEADPPVPSFLPYVTDPGGGGHSRLGVSGRMVRVSDGVATFTSTDEPVNSTVTFHRWPGDVPGCA
jgi:hypothetical protein